MLYNLQFVGRSHPANLMHGIIPLVLLVTIEIAPLLCYYWEKLLPSVRLVTIVAICCLVSVGSASNLAVGMHPGLLDQALSGGNVESLFAQFGFGKGKGDVVLDTDPAGKADVLMPDGQTEWTNNFRAAVSAVRLRSARGERVAVLDNDDGGIYLASGVTPWDRYSPVLPLLLTAEDVARLQGRLERYEADTVFIANHKVSLSSSPNTLDVDEYLHKILDAHYRRVGEIGDFDVYVAPKKGGGNTTP